MKILFIDDHASEREAYAEFLERLGYTIVQAEDGASAIKTVESDSEIGLIFTDFDMPDITGGELTQRLRAMGFTAPIVIVSGHQKVKEQYREFGADAFIPRGMHTPDQLEAAVQQYLPH